MTATNKITLVFCFLIGVAFASTANSSIKEKINKVGKVDEINIHKDGRTLQDTIASPPPTYAVWNTNPLVFLPTNPPLSTPTPGSAVENSCLPPTNPPLFTPAVVENPCVICVGGVTFDGVFEDEEGCTGTCHSAKSKIATAFELGSGECSITLHTLEPICCPPPTYAVLNTNPPVFLPTNPPLSTPTPGAVVENPCVICMDGVTFHGEFEDEEGVTGTCPSAISRTATAFELGSEKCSIALNKLERLCCPTPHENPCNLCPDGITNDGNFRGGDGYYSSSSSSNTISKAKAFRRYTCFDVDSVVKQFESGSETCTSYVDEFDICCGITSPTPAENPTSGGVAFSGFGAFGLVFIFWEVYAVGFMW
jgi:hypothetical protein